MCDISWSGCQHDPKSLCDSDASDNALTLLRAPADALDHAGPSAVAITLAAIVGYSQWSKPAPPEGREPDPPSVSQEAAATVPFETDENPPSFDQEKLREYRIVQEAEEKRVLGEERTKNVWCRSLGCRLA